MTGLTRRGATLVAALALAMVFAACGGDEEAQRDTGTAGDAQTPGQPNSGQGEATAGDDGRGLFASTCASCHTLAAADAGGQIGPNLDELQPDRERVLEAIRTGPGTMPENLYEGTQAETVAEYVAQNAGQ